MRLSSHKLNIETGRYKNIRPEERTCELCHSETEDESHFFLRCIFYKESRTTYLNLIEDQINLEGLSDLQKLGNILNCEEHSIIMATGKFLKSLWDQRKKGLSDIGK